MIKLLLILLVGLTFESTGVVLLKKGMTHIGDMNGITAGEIVRVCRAGATNPQILLGIFFEALFFLCLLILMSKSDISFLWPLTGLSFVFATFAAIWFLDERVSMVRWVGVVLIVIGAAFISYSQQAKQKPTPPPVNQSSATRQ
ncbi:MAG TPA: EamA family transporter [Verrucomicrobiae bacterium]|nr:EamA family transporter [Verrucomicrobiae bacterium]